MISGASITPVIKNDSRVIPVVEPTSRFSSGGASCIFCEGEMDATLRKISARMTKIKMNECEIGEKFFMGTAESIS